MNNNKGVVLIIALWVLLVLSLIAWGLGRRSSMEISLLSTYQGKLHSYAAARAGINTVVDLMQKSPSTKDTLYMTGIALDPSKTPENIFSHIDTGENSYAIIQWPAENYNTPNATQLEYGIADEGGRININAIGINNYQTLSALLQLKGMSLSDADKLALAIVNYTGINAQASSNFLSDANDTSLKPKNKHYENLLELLEVNGMTKEIFDKIKDDITVFGDIQNGLWINTDTANNDVLTAVANATLRTNPTASASDILRDAYTVRDGADGQSFTIDDAVSSTQSISDPNWPNNVLMEGVSGYYRIRAVGVDENTQTRTVLEAVVHEQSGTTPEIIAWQRD